MTHENEVQTPLPPQHPLNACIFGASLDVGNRGVLALGASLAQLLAAVSPGIAISFHYGGRTAGIRHISTSGEEIRVAVHNYRMSPKGRLSEHIFVLLALALLHRLGFRGPAQRNPWLRAVLDADFIGDIRGGDSFSDIYGVDKFLIGTLPLLTVVLLRRPYALLPQTYGPFRYRVSRLFAKLVLQRAAKLLTRDHNSKSVVADLCGRTPDFCPDVAFTLTPGKPMELYVAPEGLNVCSEPALLGFNISGLLYMGGYNRRNMFGLRDDYRKTVCEVLDAILEKTNCTVLLVPHVFGSEQEEGACWSVRRLYESRYPGRIFAVTQPLNERELKWLISKTVFFVGSRMHACIAALSQFVPTLGLAYSDKFLGVFESAGVGDTIADLRAATTADVVAQALAAFGRRDEIRARLRAQIPSVQKAVMDTFVELASVSSPLV